MDRSNLTVLTNALVTRLTFEDKRATSMEIAYNGKVHRMGAGLEVVLSLGAIKRPKVLMQSGIGNQADSRHLGIPLIHHLPGVGQNFQDDVTVTSCMWEFQHPMHPCDNAAEAAVFWRISVSRIDRSCHGSRPARPWLPASSSANATGRYSDPIISYKQHPHS